MTSTVALLNRLLAIHYRSLPMYLDESGTWRTADSTDRDIENVLKAIVFDYKQTCGRIAETILNAGEAITPSNFPMEYTDKNDLSLEYLVGEMLESVRRDKAAIEKVLFTLPAQAPVARELAEEALGAAKAHLDTLESLAKQPA